MYIVRKIGGKKNSLIAGTKFLKFPHLKIVDVDFRIISKAPKIVETYSLKPRDAIHAACVTYCNGEIITSDSDFDVVDIKMCCAKKNLLMANLMKSYKNSRKSLKRMLEEKNLLIGKGEWGIEKEKLQRFHRNERL